MLSLPSRSPWLNPIEPRWMHGKRAVVEPDRKLTAAELQRRLCDHYRCPLVQPLAQQAARSCTSGSLASGCAIIGNLGRRGDDVTAAEGSAAPAERCGAAIALTAEPLSERTGSPGCPGRAGRG